MALIRIEYPSGGAFEAEGKDLNETVTLMNIALATLWGRKKYGDNAVSLEEIDRWLKQSSR